MVQKSYILLLFKCLICSGLLLTQTQAFSQAKISFQGVLKTASGTPVPDDEYEFTFSFWKSQSSTAPADKLLKKGATDFNNPSNQWSETVSLNVAGGIYSHNLGSIEPLNPENFNGPVYLNIRVRGSDILPRTEFTYAPFAFSVGSAQEVVCSGAVGDIKYSILPPDKFKEVNGDCWVPLDGRTLATTDELYSLGVITLPNAGGMFLRAQDFSVVAGLESWKPKNSSDNDPDRDHTSNPGSMQDDGLKAHNHTGITDSSGMHTHGPIKVGMADQSQYDFRKGVYPTIPRPGQITNDPLNNNWGLLNDEPDFYVTNAGSKHKHPFTTDNTGSAETRPKNMNFWIYIRIN
jgi:hypothetical protein